MNRPKLLYKQIHAGRKAMQAFWIPRPIRVFAFRHLKVLRLGGRDTEEEQTHPDRIHRTCTELAISIAHLENLASESEKRGDDDLARACGKYMILLYFRLSRFVIMAQSATVTANALLHFARRWGFLFSGINSYFPPRSFDDDVFQ